MVKHVLSAMLVLTVVSQGIVHAEEPARSGDVITAPDHGALLEYIVVVGMLFLVAKALLRPIP